MLGIPPRIPKDPIVDQDPALVDDRPRPLDEKVEDMPDYCSDFTTKCQTLIGLGSDSIVYETPEGINVRLFLPIDKALKKSPFLARHRAQFVIEYAPKWEPSFLD